MDADLEKIYATLHSTHWMWEIHKKDLKKSLDLLTFFNINLPHIDTSSWNERFEWGGIFINGHPVTSNVPLIPPCKIEYFEPKLPFSELAKLYPPFIPEKHLLFEDSDLIVAFKPAGLPSKPAKEQNKFSLLHSLEVYSKRKLHMPSRLDLATAGVIIVSKSKRANITLQQMFERHSIHKFYLLEVSDKVNVPSFRVDKPIGRDKRHPILRCITPEGKPSQTIFTKICDTPAGTILQAEPLTGRTHQIRVHSASEGFPLIGDPFYGGAPAPELHLVSYRLQINHPFTQQTLDIRVPSDLLPDWLKGAEAFLK